jgi:hypothetical protein
MSGKTKQERDIAPSINPEERPDLQDYKLQACMKNIKPKIFSYFLMFLGKISAITSFIYSFISSSSREVSMPVSVLRFSA